MRKISAVGWWGEKSGCGSGEEFIVGLCNVSKRLRKHLYNRKNTIIMGRRIKIAVVFYELEVEI